jgi:hypothetical protein
MNKRFRASCDVDQLIIFLKLKEQQASQFLIWQNAGPKKITFNSAVLSFKSSGDQVLIDLNLDESKKITKQKNIYLFSEEENILLKGSISSLWNSNIQILISKSFYLNEYRIKPRIDILSKNLMCQISRRIELKNIEKSESLKLRDISESGCSFVINSSRVSKYQKGSDITIQGFGPLQLGMPLVATINHVSPVKLEGSMYNTSFLVGVSFLNDFKLLPDLLKIIDVGSVE